MPVRHDRQVSILDVMGPVMVGPSRKAFLGALTGLPVAERLPATIAAVVAAALAGARFVRVHDVAPVRAALLVADAIRGARRAP